MADSKSTIMRIALAGLAIAQAVAPPLVFAGGFDLAPGQPGQSFAQTPIVPAEYAFQIWWVIYAACIAWAGWHLFADRGGGSLFRQIAGPVAATFVLCILWLVVARFGPISATAPILAAMVAFLGHALIVASGSWPGSSRWERLLTIGMLGLYAGWTSIAVFANITEVGAARGFGFFGLAIEEWTVVALMLATVLACALAWAARGPWSYLLAVAWGLVAIIVANAEAERMAIQVTCALGLLAVLLTTLAARPRRPVA